MQLSHEGHPEHAFSQRVALRADFTFGRSTANDGRPDGSGVVALDGQEFNRFFYGGDIQWRLPIGDRISPYIFGGGGAVTIDPNFSSGTGSGESFTKGAGKFGVGLEWDLNRSGLALLTQGTAWVYDMDNATFGFEETQFDLIYSLGLSYTIGF